MMLFTPQPAVLICNASSFAFDWENPLFNLTFSRSQNLPPLISGSIEVTGKLYVEWHGLMRFAATSMTPVVIILMLAQVKSLISHDPYTSVPGTTRIKHMHMRTEQ
ncbi:hypothetical protein [Gynuella sunshinyii]|uniref:Uncharacterized protein n=1 Tax=Gynuella sunshinyii YC6258 TaxID=1445510 RepID=A0A0C5VGB3_9GAMM|nr:hypothetical protein [Gynuella sunshinyii]AJQ93221.1 hypothetical Protein YC6258_01174 [Gynuella sunshinyii YC6258]